MTPCNCCTHSCGRVCRYAYPTAQMFREIREELIWADGGAVKKATDAAILALLGPKTEADLQAGKKKPAKKVSRYCTTHKELSTHSHAITRTLVCAHWVLTLTPVEKQPF